MGDHEGWAQPTGLLPNGLLPNEAASVTRALNMERWLKAEERTAELIACIQPNQPSEGRRNAVADYVKRLIMKCFSCQVFTFGSVPLKTYLPDGDIDLIAFSKNPNLKDTWAQKVRDMLESEKKSECAEFHVKEVQYIQAKVLYRFLEFFSNFDWDNFCVSLWGPVPICSLPEMTAEPPRRDSGELLLSKPFLDNCIVKFAVFPGGPENQGQPFISRHFNVIDFLCTNNNLGRSVSKGNFFRIRSAFAFGAKRLARLLECPKEKLITEVDPFFMNTWERHGSGHRPDAPSPDLWPAQTLNPISDEGPENSRNHTAIKRKSGNVRLHAGHESQADGNLATHVISSQLGNTTKHSPENMSRTSNVPTVSRTQSHPIYSDPTSGRFLDQATRNISSSEAMPAEKVQRSSRKDCLGSEREGMARYHFARTQSSPELTDTYGEVLSQGRQIRLHETGKNQFSSARPDHSSRRNIGPEISACHSTRSSTDDPSSLTHSSSHQSLDATAADSNSVSNSYHDDASGLGPLGEELVSVTEAIDMLQEMMHQEEQDLINLKASSRIHNLNGQVQVPLNFASAHLPLSISPSVLASMGYAQRNLAGIVPAANIHLIEPPWGSNMQFTHGLVSPQIPHCFPTAGLASNPEEMSESGNDDSGLTELIQEDGNGFWKEQETGPSRGFDPDNGNFQMLQSDDRHPSTPRGYSYVSSRASSSGSSSTRGQHKFVKENRRPLREDHSEAVQCQDNIGNDYSTDRNASLRFSPVTQASSSRSKPVHENSWDGSTMKTSKTIKDKRGRKTGSPGAPSTAYRKVKSGGWQHESAFSDLGSLADDDNREWVPHSMMDSTEMAERSTGPVSVAAQHVQSHQLPGLEPTQISGSESVMPIAPMLVGSSSRQRAMDNSGVFPFSFYQTGPPVPFLTMLPVYNFQTETGNSDGSTSHFDRDDGVDRNHIRSKPKLGREP